MREFLDNKLVQGALSGLLAAIVVDIHAFIKWRDYDHFAEFNYKLMLVRWLQGIVSGAVLALGYDATK
jgi:hypothetical protein